MQKTLRDMGSIPGSGRSSREGNSNPLQYFCLANPKDKGAWLATVHRVAKSQTWLKQLSTRGFLGSHIQMWEVSHKESWALKNWCFWIVVQEKILESPLDCKEIKPVNPKGNQSWIFSGRADAEAELPMLWPPDGKSWLTGEDPDAGKDWGQEEKKVTEWDGWMASTQWTWVWANPGR